MTSEIFRSYSEMKKHFVETGKLPHNIARYNYFSKETPLPNTEGEYWDLLDQLNVQFVKKGNKPSCIGTSGGTSYYCKGEKKIPFGRVVWLCQACREDAYVSQTDSPIKMVFM